MRYLLLYMIFSFICFFDVSGKDIIRVQEILDKSCTSCHKQGGSRFDLTNISDEYLIQNGMIKAGDASSSVLVKKLKGEGGNMPTNGSISEAERIDIKSWINSLSVPTTNSKLSENVEVKRYHKCYRQFVETRMPLSDGILERVKSGEITGDMGCYELLANASTIKTSLNDPLSKKIVNSFQKMHLSWFPVERNFANTNGLFDAIYDTSGPALYFTKALFSDENYSNIFTQNLNVKAYRDAGIRTYSDRLYITGVDHEAHHIQEGQITALGDKEPIRIDPSLGFNSDRDRDVHGGRIANNHLGGGVLGSSSFIFLHEAFPPKIDGGVKLHRTLTKKIFNYFFCRDLPVVRPGDQNPYVSQQEVPNIPFRSGSSCMACHSSIDPMARAYRNIVRGRINPGQNNLSTTTPDNRYMLDYIRKLQVTEGAEDLSKWPDSVSDFNRRPPNGRLFYRDFTGKLHNQSFEGVDGLGRLLIESDDIYACTASKYFKSLTGISVNLDDLGSIYAMKLSKKEKLYRKMVIKWGKDLKKHQNIKLLIKDIVKSEAYLNPGLGGE